MKLNMDNWKADLRLIDLGLTPADRKAIDGILQEIGGYRESVDSITACFHFVEDAAGPLSLIIDIDAVPADDQLLHRINKLNPYCSVLILSTRSFHPELKESLRRNIFAVINKSSTHNELHTCLQALLESSQIPGYTGKRRDE